VSQLRWDPLKNIWVVIADRQSRRPRDFIFERQELLTSACPFCYGHEEKTPPEVFAIRPDGSRPNRPGWRVRVIPNKYPLLRIEGDLQKRGDGIYDVMSGIGAHEVIIETPDHLRSQSAFSIAELTDVLRAYRARLLDLRRDKRFRYLMIFKNEGLAAGATIPHSHSQLLALPVLPPQLRMILASCRDYFLRKELCLMCAMISQEAADGRRIVRDDGEYVAFAPYASRFPFEVLIVPRRHRHDFALLDDQELVHLAEAMSDILRRQRGVLRDPPYNFILHTAPPMHHIPGKPGQWSSLPYDFHWHIELVPRLLKPSGFEWGTGFHINPTAPEEAAHFLRDIELSSIYAGA
jgi:UDPglucose--hexose-1-phosphate uridylyltransferase